MELGGLHPHPQAHALPPEQEASPTRPSCPAAVIAAVIRGKRSFFMVAPNEPLSKRYKNNPHSTGVGSTPRESHSLYVFRCITSVVTTSSSWLKDYLASRTALSYMP